MAGEALHQVPKRSFRTSSAILFVAMLVFMTGCVSKDHNLALAQATMQPCCNSFREISYENLTEAGSGIVAIDETTPLYAFEGGKSFFKAFRLPSEVEVITVKSFYDPGSLLKNLFRPVVTLLNEDYSRSRTIRLPLQREEYGKRPMFVYGTVEIKSKERYLIVHTDDDAYGDSFHHFYPKEQIERQAHCTDPRMSVAATVAFGVPISVPASKDSICKNSTGKKVGFSVTGTIEVLGEGR